MNVFSIEINGLHPYRSLPILNIKINTKSSIFSIMFIFSENAESWICYILTWLPKYNHMDEKSF